MAGVSTKTLRVYERKGLLLPERNADNQYRIYTEAAVRKLEQIQLMKYLGFSLEQIALFLSGHENGDREAMLLTQKRLLEKKKTQLNSVIACVERAVAECRSGSPDSEAFLSALGSIVKNQRSDELVGRLGMHSDEPRGWSEFVFEAAKLREGIRVLDAGAGYGNLWRYNFHRIPKGVRVTCVDRHNTHADGFYEYVKEKERANETEAGRFDFVWEDLETSEFSEQYHCIFFNHVASFIRDRVALYEKFRNSLLPEGVFICTWGGMLVFDNAMAVFNDFLEDIAPLNARRKKHEAMLLQYERELKTVFSEVERKSYVTTLRFESAEEYMEYLLQVCKSVEEELERRRTEFLAYLNRLQGPTGGFEFVRDTYLYCCKKEVQVCLPE